MFEAAVLRVDTSRWPVSILTYSGKPTNEQLADHLREVEAKVLGRGEPFVQIVDQRRGEMPDAVQRATIAEHQLRAEAQYRSHCRGEVYVVSAQVKGAMVAVFWRAPPPYPYTFVESMADALDWARTRLVEPQPSS